MGRMLMWHMMAGGHGMARHGLFGFMIMGLARRVLMRVILLALIAAVLVLWLRSRQPDWRRPRGW